MVRVGVSRAETIKYWVSLVETTLTLSKKRNSGDGRISMDITGYDVIMRDAETEDILLLRHTSDNVIDLQFAPLNRKNLESWYSILTRLIAPAIKYRKMHLPPSAIRIIGKLTARLDLCQIHLSHIERLSKQISRKLLETHTRPTIERPSVLRGKLLAKEFCRENARDLVHLQLDVEESVVNQLKVMEEGVRKAWKCTYNYVISIGQSEIRTVVGDWSQIAADCEKLAKSALVKIENKNVELRGDLKDLLEEGDVNFQIKLDVTGRANELSETNDIIADLVDALNKVSSQKKQLDAMRDQEQAEAKKLEASKLDVEGTSGSSNKNVDGAVEKETADLKRLRTEIKTVQMEIGRMESLEVEAYSNELGERMVHLAHGEDQKDILPYDVVNESNFRGWYKSLYGHPFSYDALTELAEESSSDEDEDDT